MCEASSFLVAKVRMVKAVCSHGVAVNLWRMNVEINAPAKPVWMMMMMMWFVFSNFFAAIRCGCLCQALFTCWQSLFWIECVLVFTPRAWTIAGLESMVFRVVENKGTEKGWYWGVGGEKPSLICFVMCVTVIVSESSIWWVFPGSCYTSR